MLTPYPRALLSDDGVRLQAVHDPALLGGRDLAFVLVPGFTGSWRRPELRRLARWFSSYGGVVGLDLRGHGGSSGVSTLGDLEILDLDAAVRWARLLGYGRVVTVGFSMGGSVVLRHAALLGHAGAGLSRVDAVVSVSAAARWFYRGTRPMRLVHRAVETRSGRLYARHAMRTRIAASGWDPPPEPPVEVVGRIAPTPLLLVHGARDHYFPLEHAEALAMAAGQPSELWVEAGMAHAETAATADLAFRIARWASSATARHLVADAA